MNKVWPRVSKKQLEDGSTETKMDTGIYKTTVRNNLPHAEFAKRINTYDYPSFMENLSKMKAEILARKAKFFEPMPGEPMILIEKKDAPPKWILDRIEKVEHLICQAEDFIEAKDMLRGMECSFELGMAWEKLRMVDLEIRVRKLRHIFERSQEPRPDCKSKLWIEIEKEYLRRCKAGKKFSAGQAFLFAKKNNFFGSDPLDFEKHFDSFNTQFYRRRKYWDAKKGKH